MRSPIHPSRGAADFSASGRIGPRALPHYDRARIACAAGLPIEAIEVVDTVGSTSTALMQRGFSQRAAPPRVLLAIEQTAGRGRRGRGWLAPAHCSMALSVAIERTLDARSAPYRALPLALGVAIADRLAGFGCALRLKWPNDLLQDGAKAAGLLVEARRAGSIERVVAGLGLNLLDEPGLSERAGQPAAALFSDDVDAQTGCGDADGGVGGGIGAGADGSARPPLPDRSLLAGALAGEIVRTCARNAAEGFAPWRPGWLRRDALAGRPVRILQADDGALDGIACGVDDEGALLVDTAGCGIRRILAGEASVRPAA